MHRSTNSISPHSVFNSRPPDAQRLLIIIRVYELRVSYSKFATYIDATINPFAYVCTLLGFSETLFPVNC